MTILTVQFERNSSTVYGRLLEAFQRSVEENMPEAKFEVIRLGSPSGDTRGRWGFFANTEKLWAWDDYVRRCDDEVILADCDMIMRASAEHAFDEPFDIAYTRRTGKQRIPINNGIVMVRPTDEGKGFVQRWAEVNQQMYDDPAFHREWKKLYPGMNQAAFGYLLDTGEHEAQLYEYGTRQWNAVEVDWEHLQDDTVFVHYKGALRRRITSGSFPVGACTEAVLLWFEYGSGLPPLSLKAKRVLRGNGRSGGKWKQPHATKVREALLAHSGLVEKALAEGRSRV